MRTKEHVGLALVGGFVSVAVMASSGLAAPPSKNYTEHPSDSVTLRDAAGDVVLSDGQGAYTGKSIGGITDWVQTGAACDPFADGVERCDRFTFYPQRNRTFGISVGSGESAVVDTECNFIQVWSKENSNWYDDLNNALLPTTSPAEARVYCWNEGDTPQWVLDYPDQKSTPEPEAECVTISKAGTTWTFSAAAECLGDVIRRDWNKGGFVDTVIQDNVSLPFSLTATISS